MTYRRMLFLASGLFLACPWSWAQNDQAVLATRSLANGEIHFGEPRPLVPRSAVRPGQVRPFVWITNPLVSSPTPFTSMIPASLCAPAGPGFCAAGLQAAYSVNSIIGGNGGAGMTIGIVDWFNDPNIQADLQTFDILMGLPDPPSFTVLNQNGNASPLPANSPQGGSADTTIEISLDVEWAHAMAPKANIILIEANGPDFGDLVTAFTTAAGLADIITNSYGANEFNGETTLDSFYSTGKTAFFSSGDFGVQSYPCASPNVTCVGGTSLTVNASDQRTSETAWACSGTNCNGGGSGGGCSPFEAAPAFQSVITACGAFRATPDIAADANPSTGVWITDTFDFPMDAGICCVGGTSLASPLMAGVFADIDAARIGFGKAKFGGPASGIFLDSDLYAAFHANLPYFFFDVTSGCNREGCAAAGYDLVTGVGVSRATDIANRFFGFP